VGGGPSLLVVRGLALAARAALALLLYAMARPLVRQPVWAALPGVFLLLALDDSPVRWEPHPGWLSTLFAVVAAWCLTRGTGLRWFAASGLAAGVAYAFKQNTGVFILAAVVLWGALAQPRGRRVAAILLAFSIVTTLWLVPLVFAVDGDLASLAVLIGAVNQTGLFSPPEFSIVVPLAAFVGGVWRIRYEAEAAFERRWYLVAGCALFCTQYPRMDTVHLAWSAPLLLVVGAAVLDRLRPAIAVVGVIALALMAQPTVVSRLDYLRQPLAKIAGVVAPSDTAADVQGAIASIQQRTHAGDPIFVYPSSPLLYVLAERPNPTRFDHLNPGAADAAQIQRVIADLDRANLPLVVVSDYWRAVWGEPGANAPLEAWLEAHFMEVERHGPYRVLAPRL
jgi:hypothetical protein